MAIYNGHNEDSSGNILLSIGNGMTATVETGSTASQAYTKGSYLFFNNRLCKATSAIASGATLAVGTNLSQTSIGQELTSHLRSSDGKEFYFDLKDGKYGYYPSASKVASEFVPFGGTYENFNDISGSGSGYQTTAQYSYTFSHDGECVVKCSASLGRNSGSIWYWANATLKVSYTYNGNTKILIPETTMQNPVEYTMFDIQAGGTLLIQELASAPQYSASAQAVGFEMW